MREQAVISSFVAWVLWLGNWFTINGTVRNGFLSSGHKPGPITRSLSDIWNLIAAVAATSVLFLVNDRGCLAWLAVYRCAAIVVSQAAVLVNTDLYVYGIDDDDDLRDNRRLLLIGLLHYAELVLWFAVVYRHYAAHFLTGKDIVSLSEAWGALYFSAATITTLGYGDIRPLHLEGARIVVCQLAAGTFMALIVLGRFVGLIKSG